MSAKKNSLANEGMFHKITIADQNVMCSTATWDNGWGAFHPEIIDLENCEDDSNMSSPNLTSVESLDSISEPFQSSESDTEVRYQIPSNTGRNERHKLVERQRRENTRNILSD